ncbi:MAG: rhodanese-like domain-containing protein [Verrucomicrobiota bacterium]
MPVIPSVTVAEAAAVLNSPSTALIDVRTPGEFRGEHAEGAINLPLDSISAEEVQRATDGASHVYVICQSGKRSLSACEKLAAAGMAHLTNVQGGTNAWTDAQLPVKKGQGVISIERQVRIGAGLLVFTGVLLGFYVHPLWLILPGFAGAGLTFAGITDFCGMGLILAKMPWNR